MKKSILSLRVAVSSAAFVSTLPALAQFDLSNYELSGTFDLTLPVNDEASGVTYNFDNNRLYIVEDEGEILFETDLQGTVLSSMSMSGFDDVEGVTYIGGGEFLLTEERVQDVFKFSYVGGSTLTQSALLSFSFGGTVGNVGLEGISYDFINDLVYGVKEKTPQFIYTADIDLGTMTGTVGGFAPSLGLSDLSDVQVLSAMPSLIGTADQDNLLILSQESDMILEVTQSGSVESFFDFSALGTNSAEGITLGPDGTIYVVSEDPKLFVFTPGLATIPEPASATLFLGLGALLLSARRRRHL
jgi:hypothetical protein